MDRITARIVYTVDGKDFANFSDAIEHCENLIHEFVCAAMPTASVRDRLAATDYVLNHRAELVALLNFQTEEPTP